MRILQFLIILSCLSLAACSTTPKNPQVLGANAQGLVGVTMNGKQESANFNWYVSDDGMYHIELYGPLGVGSTYLDGNDQNVNLTLPNQDSYHAHSPEILMQNVLGWSMPVEGLTDWLFARPMPNVTFTATRDEDGRLLTLEQEGWDITYTWESEQNFPHKIVLVRSNIKVVIVINKIY